MRMIKPTAFGTVFVIAGTLAALAHAKMTASVPNDGANVGSPVSAIELSFSKPLRLTSLKVVRDSDQEQMPLAEGHPKTVGTSMKAAVRPLQVGSYKVSWTAVAEDGHVMKGSFGFFVSEAAGSQA